MYHFFRCSIEKGGEVSGNICFFKRFCFGKGNEVSGNVPFPEMPLKFPKAFRSVSEIVDVSPVKKLEPIMNRIRVAPKIR